MKYYRITLSSKISKIKEGLFLEKAESGATCSNSVLGVSIPSSLSAISDMAFFECKNIESIAVGDTTYKRPEGANEIAIKIGGNTVIEKINSEPDCTVLPFELSMPLCPEDMVSE